MNVKFRQVIGAILLTSIISFLIGSFAIWSSYHADLNLIDRSLHEVAAEPLIHPQDAINEALAYADMNSVDVAIAFFAPPSEVTILREAKELAQLSIDNGDLLRSLTGPTFLHSNQHARAISMKLPEGEYLLFAISTHDLDRNLRSNEVRLLIFILIANFLAALVTIWLTRRQRALSEKEQLRKMQEFLGDAAHELRTPLTVIKGYAELLAKKKMPSQADEERAFDRLENEISRMDSLITDLLLLAELGEASSVIKSNFNLSELLRNHVNDFQVISPTHPVRIDIDEGIEYLGSQIHIQRMIQNALVNIDRHTPKESPVAISLTVNGKVICLVIEDGGPGLNESAYGESIRSLQRFDRSRSRETGGTGLGMSIMSAVISMHNGSLSLRKSTLGGLAIDIRLPISR